eukprot:m.928870 g.928870  ORF g.928870 m.928870 type:complete len:704 (-) comp23780_c0_seq11:979-3090(-)
MAIIAILKVAFVSTAVPALFTMVSARPATINTFTSLDPLVVEWNSDTQTATTETHTVARDSSIYIHVSKDELLTVVPEPLFKRECQSRISHSELRSFMELTFTLLDAQEDGILRTVQDQVSEWDTNLLKHNGDSATYPIPDVFFQQGRRDTFPTLRIVPGSQIMSHEPSMKHEFPVQKTEGVYHIVSMDDITTTAGAKQEYIYIVSSKCRKLCLIVNEKYHGNTCAPLDESQETLAREFSFSADGGVQVMTYAGSGIPYNHSRMNALKQAYQGAKMIFQHAHNEKQRNYGLVHNDRVQLSHPWGCAYDTATNSLFVANGGVPESSREDDVIIQLHARRQGEVVAGGRQGYHNGRGRRARFRYVAAATMDSTNGILYMAENGNNCIRGYKLDTHEVFHVAGWVNATEADASETDGGFQDGSFEEAKFNLPQGITYVHEAHVLYVADCDNHRIRTVDLATRTVTTLVGGDMFGSTDGRASDARLRHPTEVAFDATRRVLYFSDHYNNRIRFVRHLPWDRLASGHTRSVPMVETLAGSGATGHCDGFGSSAMFFYPEGLWINEAQSLVYVADYQNNQIRVVGGVGHATAEGFVATLAGTGEYGHSDVHSHAGSSVGSGVKFSGPSRICADPQRNVLFVVDQLNHRIREVYLPNRSASGTPATTDRNVQLAVISRLSTFIILVVLLCCICKKQIGICLRQPLRLLET